MQIYNSKSKRTIVSINSRHAVIFRRKKGCKKEGDQTVNDVNSAGNLRGMNEASRANLGKTSDKPGEWQRRNLAKCSNILFKHLMAKDTDGSTWRAGWLRAAFITLTIPDSHTRIDSKHGYRRLLKRFIEAIKYWKGLDAYLWKFEWQKENRQQGHWHMIVDRYLPKDELKQMWISFLKKEGLVSDWYENNEADPEFSCDIRGIRSEGSLQFYLDKYFHKSYQNEDPTEGRIWGCSMWIKKAKPITVPYTRGFHSNVEKAKNNYSYEIYDIRIDKEGGVEAYAPELCNDQETSWLTTVIRAEKLPIELLLCDIQQKWYNDYMEAYRMCDWEQSVTLYNRLLEANEIEVAKGEYEMELIWQKVGLRAIEINKAIKILTEEKPKEYGGQLKLDLQ